MKITKFLLLPIAAALLAVSLVSCAEKKPDSETGDTGAAKFNYSAGLTEDGYFANLKASDYVTLPTYKGVPISPDVFVASEEALNEQIDSILSNYAKKEKITDRAVADGDTLNIDYVGKVGGVEFDGGNTKGAGTDVTIGVTQYIDDFLQQLIGHKPGETFDIEVTFPDPYSSNTELSGKDAVFTVTINYIQGEAEKIELTDEIAADYKFENKEALIADIKTWLVNQQKLQFFNKLVEGVECSEIPASVLEYVKNEDLAYYANYAESNSMDMDTFMKNYMGYESLDAYVASQADNYKKTATKYIIVQAIAEAEGLTVTDADVTANGYDANIETYGSPYLKLFLLNNKIVPVFVADKAIIEK